MRLLVLKLWVKSPIFHVFVSIYRQNVCLCCTIMASYPNGGGYLEITKEDYIQARLEDQIKWYDEKSIHCQKVYKRLKRTEVILATAIPLLSGIASKNELLPFVVGILGATIAVIEGFLNIGKYHEHWIEYRGISETLKHEKYMFLTKTGVYIDENPFRTLVERIESVISHENVNWAQINKSNGGKTDGKEKNIH